MWCYQRGISYGSWLPEEKKANMCHGRGNSGGSWQPAFPGSTKPPSPSFLGFITLPTNLPPSPASVSMDPTGIMFLAWVMISNIIQRIDNTTEWLLFYLLFTNYILFNSTRKTNHCNWMSAIIGGRIKTILEISSSSV